PESNLQSLQRRGREPHRLEIPRDRAVLAVDEGPYRHRARLLEVPAHGLEQPPAQVTAAVVGMDPEALDPAARFLEPELPRAQVGEHEPDESPVVLRHLGGAGIAAQVIAHAAFPDLGAVDAGDALVDIHDTADVELVEGSDAGFGLDAGHREGLPEVITRGESGATLAGLAARRRPTPPAARDREGVTASIQ